MLEVKRNLALTIAWFGVAMLVMTVASSGPARAQDTREDPCVPEPSEPRIVMLAQAVLNHRPLYPFLGSAFEGGGLAAGPGYRARFADSGTFDAHAAWSWRNYKAADAVLRLPGFATPRLGVEMHATWSDAPSVAFYGVGIDSVRNGRAAFLYEAATVGTTARVQAARHFALGGGFDVIAIRTGAAGRGTSIERDFTPATAPGLGADPTYRRSRVFARFDSRESPGRSRSGGLYRVEWSAYQQAGDGPYGFRRTDVEVQQFVPLLDENGIIALRALASSIETASGSAVPHFMMPALGGHTLRGYPSWRFRDRNRMLLTGEYRRTAGRFIGLALFADAGNVAPRLDELDLHDLKTSYGIGLSLRSLATTWLRVDVARTREGTSLVFSFHPSF